MTYRDLDEALTMHNAVPQGLSSAIFTLNLRYAERFLSVRGSDCGIANVNIYPLEDMFKRCRDRNKGRQRQHPEYFERNTGG